MAVNVQTAQAIAVALESRFERDETVSRLNRDLARMTKDLADERQARADTLNINGQLKVDNDRITQGRVKLERQLKDERQAHANLKVVAGMRSSESTGNEAGYATGGWIGEPPSDQFYSTLQQLDKRVTGSEARHEKLSDRTLSLEHRVVDLARRADTNAQLRESLNSQLEEVMDYLTQLHAWDAGMASPFTDSHPMPKLPWSK